MNRATNISLPEALWEKANILAVRKRISFSELVRQAVTHYVAGDHVDELEIMPDGKVEPVEAEARLVKGSA